MREVEVQGEGLRLRVQRLRLRVEGSGSGCLNIQHRQVAGLNTSLSGVPRRR